MVRDLENTVELGTGLRVRRLLVMPLGVTVEEESTIEEFVYPTIVVILLVIWDGFEREVDEVFEEICEEFVVTLEWGDEPNTDCSARYRTSRGMSEDLLFPVCRIVA